MKDEKEQLVDEILRLRREVQTLQQELKKLQERLPVKSNKPQTYKFKENRRSKPPHLWGRKAGHPGSWRPTPDHIDREIKQTLKVCPDCRHAFGEAIAVEKHLQEDIIPARVEVTQFLRCRYWCRHCKKVYTAPYAEDEVPWGHLGPRTLAMMVWLKYHLALPGNKIKDILHDLCGLTVSEGAIAQALQRLGNYLHIENAQILTAVKEASLKHVDETGWNINGASHWLWTFVNQQWAFFHIDKSRGSRVPGELLGIPHQGTVVSDFYSAYNKLEGDKQKCWVHLNRDIRETRDAFPRGEDPPSDFMDPRKKLRRLFADAERLASQRRMLSRLAFIRKIRRLKERLFMFGSEPYSHPFWQKMSARILRHHRSLFTFLDKKDVPSHNNTAERSIRPHVIIRNRSFQNRTPNGALAHSRLSSILQTLRLQHRDSVHAIMSAYPKHRQGYTAPLLFP